MPDYHMIHREIPNSFDEFLEQTRVALMHMADTENPDDPLVKNPMDTITVSMGPPVSSLQLKFRKDHLQDFLVPTCYMIVKFVFQEDGTIRCLPTANVSYDLETGRCRYYYPAFKLQASIHDLGLTMDTPWILCVINPKAEKIYELWENVKEVNVT